MYLCSFSPIDSICPVDKSGIRIQTPTEYELTEKLKALVYFTFGEIWNYVCAVFSCLSFQMLTNNLVYVSQDIAVLQELKWAERQEMGTRTIQVHMGRMTAIMFLF